LRPSGSRFDNYPEGKRFTHRAVVAVIIYNHSTTKTINYAKVGPYTYTSLSIPPGGSGTNKAGHSVFKLFTGLANAALMV
jgi:hypothetical protein